MKKLLLIVLFFSATSIGAADITNVGVGQFLDLDGTSQKVTFTRTENFKTLMREQGFINIFVYSTGEDGIKVGTIPIVSAHHAYPSSIWIMVTITPASPDIWVQGSEDEEAIVSF